MCVFTKCFLKMVFCKIAAAVFGWRCCQFLTNPKFPTERTLEGHGISQFLGMTLFLKILSTVVVDIFDLWAVGFSRWGERLRRSVEMKNEQGLIPGHSELGKKQKIGRNRIRGKEH